MPAPSDPYQRIDSLAMRINALTRLRATVSLPSTVDATGRQWNLVERQLASMANALHGRLKRISGQLAGGSREQWRAINDALGEIELDLSNAFTFFDTYMDALTQRHAKGIGPMLAGCDVLARDALNVSHPALRSIEAPLVFCNRGFGAAIIRERVSLPGRAPNPMPLIQIPYLRLKQKLLLTSILHEAGHQALVQLQLVEDIRANLSRRLESAGAPEYVVRLYANWSSEIGPDFWSFCLSGTAQAAAMHDLMSLPASEVFRIPWTDPHPPAYLRVLIGFAWCRQLWGRGDWTQWERAWRATYPTNALPTRERGVVRELENFVPVVAEAYLTARLTRLRGQPLASLFDMDALHPQKIAARAARANQGVISLKGLRPCAHLAVFRSVRSHSPMSERGLDLLMRNWLRLLAQVRRPSTSGTLFDPARSVAA